jgi:hypothetical protein
MDRYLDKESIKLRLVLKDKLLGVPLDIDELEYLHVSVYHAGTGTVLEEGEYGVDNVVSTQPQDGIVFFPIEDELNDGIATGVYKVKVKIITKDTHFEDEDLVQIQEARAFKIISKGSPDRSDYTEITMYFAIGTDYYVDEDIYVDEDMRI